MSEQNKKMSPQEIAELRRQGAKVQRDAERKLRTLDQAKRKAEANNTEIPTADKVETAFYKSMSFLGRLATSMANVIENKQR